MIGQMAVRVTADRANFPLGTLFVRAGSAANIALVGVPVRPGVTVTALALRVENVDGATADYAARAIGGVWVVDVPASHFATVGSVTGGVAVWATGIGADGETPRTWCVGVGDLEVLPADADAPAPAPGQTFWPLRMFDAEPTAPTKYNAYIDGGELKIWNGVAWITISGGSGTVDDTVTRTSANPVKSSGVWGAIWGALTALPTGFASLYAWCVAQLAEKLGPSGGVISGDLRFTGPATSQYGVVFVGGSSFADTPVNALGMYDRNNGPLNLGRYIWFWPHVHPDSRIDEGKKLVLAGSVPEKTSDLVNDGGGDGSPFATVSQIPDVSDKADAADLRYRIAEAEFDASIGADGGYILADRTVNRITPQSGTAIIDVELPGTVEEPTGVRRARDFFLDIDNSANASDLVLEFTGLGVDYVFIAEKDDVIGEMMSIAGYGTGSSGDGERVRLYFTECALQPEYPPIDDIFHVARVTLGDFVTSTTTQGGN